MEVFLCVRAIEYTNIIALFLNEVKLVVELTEGVYVFIVDFALMSEEMRRELRRGP